MKKETPNCANACNAKAKADSDSQCKECAARDVSIELLEENVADLTWQAKELKAEIKRLREDIALKQKAVDSATDQRRRIEDYYEAVTKEYNRYREAMKEALDTYVKTEDGEIVFAGVQVSGKKIYEILQSALEGEEDKDENG